MSEAVPSGGFGAGVLTGVCAARVDVQSAIHEWATPVAGSTVLKSTFAGPVRLLWKEADDGGAATGVQWGVGLLGSGGAAFAVGKAAGVISARSGTTYGSGNVDLYRSNSGAEAGPLGTVSVLNPSADAAIPSGKYVSVAWDPAGVAWAAPLECP